MRHRGRPVGIGEVTGATIVGERVNGTMLGHAAADWLRPSPEGYGTLDVKITYETDDGAVIHATYSGRFQFDTMTVYAAQVYGRPVQQGVPA